jgi:hypothetical protein
MLEGIVTSVGIANKQHSHGNAGLGKGCGIMGSAAAIRRVAIANSAAPASKLARIAGATAATGARVAVPSSNCTPRRAAIAFAMAWTRSSSCASDCASRLRTSRLNEASPEILVKACCCGSV